MITLLSNLLIDKKLEEDKKRSAKGILCGIVGIAFNILLFATKLFAGLLSSSVSIMADAFNNLSDAGSSLVTLLGFKLAAHKPDPEHPYGHGRLEYLAALIVSAIIIVMGFELLKESFQKILHPEPVEFSLTVLFILLLSILLKCYMAFYNTKVGAEIQSVSMRATAMDSLSDCVATTVVLLSALLSHFAGINLDGWAGIAVSCFIFYAGFTACKEAIDPLLGSAPEEEYIAHIEQIVLDFDDQIVGVHDLMVHDYGPGRKFISLHAEVPHDGDILLLHDIIDNLEKKLSKELGCVATIHMDPVNVSDPKVAELKEDMKELVTCIYEGLTIHDFRVVFGDSHTNIIFDLAVPFACKMSDSDLVNAIESRVQKEVGSNYYCVIDIDHGTLINH